MPYQKVVDKLEELEDLSAVGFPDGSLDTYYRVRKGKEGFITEKEEVIKRLKKSGDTSLRLEEVRQEPGGKSVNMSIQANSLGVETVHFGFVDHEVFENIGFRVYSMGKPAEVDICEFEDGSLLLAKHSESLIQWQLEDLEDFQKSIESILSHDIINCANWASVHHMNSELQKLADQEFNASVFNFDPGTLEEFEDEEVKEMFEQLEKISGKCEVIVHANKEEAERVAQIYGLEGEMSDKLIGIKNATAVDAYVLHDKYRAVAGTEKGAIEVENLVTEKVETQTGAGDRFDTGVAAGRSAGWNWKESLALGNLCAVHYVENNETAKPESLRKQIEEKLQ